MHDSEWMLALSVPGSAGCVLVKDPISFCMSVCVCLWKNLVRSWPWLQGLVTFVLSTQGNWHCLFVFLVFCFNLASLYTLVHMHIKYTLKSSFVIIFYHYWLYIQKEEHIAVILPPVASLFFCLRFLCVWMHKGTIAETRKLSPVIHTRETLNVFEGLQLFQVY